MKLLTQEQHDYLVSIANGHSVQETVDMLNEKFNLDLKYEQLRCYRKNHKLPSGIDTRFKKGQISHNKGKKTPPEIVAKTRATQFKKGQIPHNHTPIGTERMTSDGYLKVKIAEPNIWKHKHRLVWEQRYGQIPSDKMITFINGDHTDCRIENLVMIDQQINSLLNKIRADQRSQELVNVVGDIVALKNKIKSLQHKT